MPRRSNWSWSKVGLAWLGAMLRLALSVGVPFLVVGLLSGYPENALYGFILGYVFFGSFLTVILIFALLPTSWLGGALGFGAVLYALVSSGAAIPLAVLVAAFVGLISWLIDIAASRQGPLKAMRSWKVRSGVR